MSVQMQPQSRDTLALEGGGPAPHPRVGCVARACSLYVHVRAPRGTHALEIVAEQSTEPVVDRRQ
jgi:hypothetical protein